MILEDLDMLTDNQKASLSFDIIRELVIRMHEKLDTMDILLNLACERIDAIEARQ